jgi:heme exporter protein D
MQGLAAWWAAGFEMLGIEDPYVWVAYLLCILSTILCVVYGLMHWNRGDETVEAADVQWAAQEDKVEEEL